MFNIQTYLEKFKNLGQRERLLKEDLSLAVQEVTGIVLNTKDIDIKNGEAIFRVSPGLKNSIFIKKDFILGRLKEKIGGQITNIR